MTFAEKFMCKFVITGIILICAALFLVLVFVFLSFTPLLYSVSDQSKLYGTYVADNEFVRERLTIKEDGTFIQEVTLKASSKVDTAKGTWTYAAKHGSFTFDHNFMCVVDAGGRLRADYAQPRDTGLVIMPARRWFFRILLGSGEAGDLAYKKID
jgi:hypothetical protein